MLPQFRERKEKLELEMRTLSISKRETNLDRMEIEMLLDQAAEFLTNFGTHWKKQPIHIQKRFQQLVYPEGVPYSRDTEFGTAKLGLIFELNRRFITQKSTMVDTAYKTLNSLKEYLAEFWGYYQSNPKMQKMLEEIPP